MTTALPIRAPGAQLLQPHALHQWFAPGDHPQDHATPGREGRVVRYYRHPDVPGSQQCGHCHELMHRHGWIDSGATGHTVCPGDFILTTTDGRHIPIPVDALTALTKELTS
jgi:hypothetical protein